MASDYVQDIVENQPDEKHNCNPTSDHLENPEGINAVGITPDHFGTYPDGAGIVSPRFFTAGIFRFRFPAAGYVLICFFTAPFHAIQ